MRRTIPRHQTIRRRHKSRRAHHQRAKPKQHIRRNRAHQKSCNRRAQKSAQSIHAHQHSGIQRALFAFYKILTVRNIQRKQCARHRAQQSNKNRQNRIRQYIAESQCRRAQQRKCGDSDNYIAPIARSIRQPANRNLHHKTETEKRRRQCRPLLRFQSQRLRITHE